MKTSHKMYLTLFLSSACIFLYQYQLSRQINANSNNQSTNNGQQASSAGVGNADSENFNLINEVVVLSASKITTDKTPLPPQKQQSRVENKQKHANKILPKKSINTSKKNPLPPPLYIITPTYRRPEQLAEITRLGYTLKHVKNIFWLVIEDADKPTILVTNLLQKMDIPFDHLIAQMPAKYRKNKIKPRGVSNRNRGLEWIRANATEGVLYFADDDNTYDLEIFEEMRFTKKVSMWPVGLITKYGVSSPIVKSGKLDGFYDGWIGGRKYPVDMAGFAVNVQFLLSRPNAAMPFKPGYEEDGFLRSLAPLNNTEIELLASNCTKILTWHTQSKKNLPSLDLDMTRYNETNLVYLKQILV